MLAGPWAALSPARLGVSYGKRWPREHFMACRLERRLRAAAFGEGGNKRHPWPISSAAAFIKRVACLSEVVLTNVALCIAPNQLKWRYDNASRRLARRDLGARWRLMTRNSANLACATCGVGGNMRALMALECRADSYGRTRRKQPALLLTGDEQAGEAIVE